MNIIINGANGKLGRSVADCAKEKYAVVAGADISADNSQSFPVYDGLFKIKEKADVIIDCSFHGAIYDLLNYAKSVNLPVVIATTGHSEEEKAFITETARYLPVFMSANMSIGVNLLAELSNIAADFLGDSFDIEIIEAHHSKKIDAPSGTALMLADAVKEHVPGAAFVYDRTVRRNARDKAEIGMHSVRGGSIVGDHEVLFAGPGEVIRLRHSALSRAVFAEGALTASRFMINKPAGLYDMKSMLRR